MNVATKCFAQLAKEKVCDYRAATEYQLPDGARVSDLIGHLGLSEEEIKLVYVNHVIVPRQTMLRDGDQVAFAPATGGM